MIETMVSFVIVVMYYGGDRAVFTELSLGQWHPCWWSLFEPGKCLNRFEQEATTKVWFWHWCWCVGLLLWVGEGSGSGRSFLRVAPVARHQPRPHSAPGRRGREWHFDFLHRHTCISGGLDWSLMTLVEIKVPKERCNHCCHWLAPQKYKENWGAWHFDFHYAVLGCW